MSTATRSVSVLLVSVSSWFCAGAARAEDLLKNGSFEEPVNSGLGYNWVSDRALCWERWGGWFNRETTWSPVSDGQCMVAYHHWRIQGNDTSGIYQDIPGVKKGKPYTFGIRVFKDKGCNAEYIEVRIEPYLGGAPLATNLYKMIDLRSGRWNDLMVTGTPVSTGARVLVITKPGRTNARKGALKFDSAALAPAPGAEPVPALGGALALPNVNDRKNANVACGLTATGVTGRR